MEEEEDAAASRSLNLVLVNGQVFISVLYGERLRMLGVVTLYIRIFDERCPEAQDRSLWDYA